MSPEGTEIELKGEDVGDLDKHDASVFEAVTKVGDFLPRLQLMTSNSKKCKSGDFPINNYAIVDGQNFIDLGSAVDVLMVTWRPKALEMGDEVIAVYDENDEQFKRIQEKADEKDSGCMFGPEYLVYVPQVKKFTTFFMGSKSARREAPNANARLKKAATLKSKEITTKKYNWYAPTVSPCSTPFEMPESEVLKEQVDKFNNPPVSEVERVEDEPKAGDDRAR